MHDERSRKQLLWRIPTIFRRFSDVFHVLFDRARILSIFRDASRMLNKPNGSRLFVTLCRYYAVQHQFFNGEQVDEND